MSNPVVKRNPKNRSLVEQALNIETRRQISTEISKERIEVAVAWANEEINLTQAAAVLKVKPFDAYRAIAFLLKEHVKNQNSPKA